MSDRANAIDIRRDGAVATITIDRPAKKNAVSMAMWLELARLALLLGRGDGVRAIVLTGRSGNFSAGADIGEFERVRGDAASARIYEAANSAVFAAFRDCAVPTIAAIDGVCYGGGFGLAAACEIRIATPEARFSIPAAKLGLAYPEDAMIDIVEALGPQMARYLAYSADAIGAQAALDAGFLLDIVEPERLADRAAELARTIADNAPLSVRASKASIRAALARDEGLSAEARALGDATFDSADYAEGRDAFKSRRKPLFSGR